MNTLFYRQTTGNQEDYKGLIQPIYRQSNSRYLSECFVFQPFNHQNKFVYLDQFIGQVCEFIDRCTNEPSENDFVQIVAKSLSDGLNIPINNYRKNLKKNDIIEKISTKIQSNTLIKFENLFIDVLVIRYMIGHAQGTSFVSMRLPTYFLKQGDTTCFFDATAYCILKYHDKITYGISPNAIYKKAKQIAVNAQLAYAAVGLNEIQTVEKSLNTPIIIFNYNQTNEIEVFYKPKIKIQDNKSSKFIHLFYYKNCFYSIDNARKLVNKKDSTNKANTDFCYLCMKFIEKINKHKCDHFCPACRTSDCSKNPADLFEKSCISCKRTFKSHSCFLAHKDKKICNRVRYCNKCDIVYNYKHDCMLTTCSVCNERYRCNDEHECIMKCKKLKSSTKESLISYFDIETMLLPDKNFKPQILISQSICSKCQDLCSGIEGNFVCNVHGNTEKIFESCIGENSCTRQYIDFLLDLEERFDNMNIIVIAHNNSSFDGCFIYETLLNHYPNNIFTTNPIKNGNKFIQFQIGKNIYFKDSMLYISQSLKKLPKIFGMEDRMRKGFFPYSFYTPENVNYDGPIPARHFFEEEKMSDSDKVEFDKYYNERSKSNYNLREECILYCRNDVYLLRSCFQKYRSDTITHFNIDPAVDCLTVASTCFTIFLKSFLNNEKILSIDRKKEKPHSIEALTWLQIIEDELGYKLTHARRFEGEKRLKLRNGKIIFADGYDPITNTIYSYHGCYWHACPICNYQNVIHNGLSGEEVYKNTLTLDALIEKQFNHVRVWSHEIMNRIRLDEGFKQKWRKYYNRNSCKHYKIDPGDSLYGGRTNPFRLYVSRDEIKSTDSTIEYLDFCSLYPYVMKNRSYPVGKPTIILKNELPSIEDFVKDGSAKYFGLVKAQILAPQEMLVPVLPKSIDAKLMFALCQKCAETMADECIHNELQRSWTGTYVSEELFLAIDRGYRILNLMEIWQFERSDTLFKDYINYFLKLKTESSGFPRDVVTAEQKEKYVQDFKDKEGISLDISNIKKNPGMRTLAKLQLNNLWGRFALNNNKINTQICSNYTELAEVLFDSSKICSSVFVTDNKAVVDYRIKDDDMKPGRYTNIPIASFTTAYARMKLFGVMESLGDRLLYCDTDSVIFTRCESKNEFQPPIGSFLGDLTDEIRDTYGSNAKGISFASTGPKTYALEIECEDGRIESIVRCKGFSINKQNQHLICADTIKQLATDELSHIQTEGFLFKPGKYGGVSLIPNNKILKKTYRKRRIHCYDTLKTLPWGYSRR